MASRCRRRVASRAMAPRRPAMRARFVPRRHRFISHRSRSKSDRDRFVSDPCRLVSNRDRFDFNRSRSDSDRDRFVSDPCRLVSNRDRFDFNRNRSDSDRDRFVFHRSRFVSKRDRLSRDRDRFETNRRRRKTNRRRLGDRAPSRRSSAIGQVERARRWSTRPPRREARPKRRCAGSLDDRKRCEPPPSPLTRRVVLQEFAPHVLPGDQPREEGVTNPCRAVDDVERGLKIVHRLLARR